MNRDILPYLLCPECGSHNLSLEEYSSSEDEQVLEGHLDCPKCSSWFRIENGILDLLPMQLRQKNYERFMRKNERFAVQHGLSLPKVEGISQGIMPEGKTKPIGAFEHLTT